MSYDILLYPRSAGQTWDDVIAADEDETDPTTLADEEALAQGVSTFRRIEARLREVLPGDVESWVAEETGGDVYGELSSTQTGLQVELFAGSAAVSFPYREHDDLPSFHEQVRQAVRVVAEETGYEAYDPQKGETFDGNLHDESGREAVRQLGTGREDDVARRGSTAADLSPGMTDPDRMSTTGDRPDAPAPAQRPAPADPRQDPSFLRKRGILYVALGVLLSVFGLWRLVGGDGGWLTILVLGIGVMDLLGGLFMLSLSRRIGAASSAGTDGPASGGPTDGSSTS